MRRRIAAAAAMLAAALAAALASGCRHDHFGLIDVHARNPRIVLDIRYATPANFTHTAVYESAECWLNAVAAARLDAVERELEPEGLRLKVWDCYRPLSVQRKFWALVPDERYVANPAKGSRHNRGAAVDLTLVRADGTELAMPTGFDDFTAKAHRDFTALPPEAVANRARLERAMVKHGFVPLPTEWWHFDSEGWESLPVMDVDFAALR
jgi:zinc D-Ala-D-Ala dipeptidase